MRLRNCLGTIWSVSTSARSRAVTPPEITRTGSMASLPLADVDEVALDGRGGGHLGRDEVRSGAPALAALEVAVRGGGDALARRGDVRVHPEAHGAAGRAPVEARGAEDRVEALALGLGANLLGARHDHGVDPRRHPAPL